MKEEFVSYSQAVALYNLDFDWDCGMAYFDRPWNHEHRLVPYTIAAKEQRDYDGTDVYPAPTLALAQKWLRDVHNIHIQITYTRNNYWKWRTDVILIDDFDNSKMIDMFKDYGIALAAGLDAALELIKQK